MDLLSLNENENENQFETFEPEETVAAVSPSPAVHSFRSSSEVITITSDEKREIKGYLSAALLAEPKEKCMLYENSFIKLSVVSEFKAFKVITSYK